MNIFRLFIAGLIGLTPFNKLRIFLYKFIFGFKIDRNSSIGPFNLIISKIVILNSSSIGLFNIIGIDSLYMDRESMIGKFNIFRKLKKIHMLPKSCILHRNFIGGTFGTSVENSREELLLGSNSQISLSCFFDLSDRIIIGDNVVIGGSGTQFWTHGFNHLKERKTGSIIISSNVFVGSASTILYGVKICSNVIIGAGTVVHRNIEAPGTYISNSLIKVS